MHPPGRVRDHAPWWFPIARRLPAKRWAAYSWLQRRGHLADTVPVQFHDATVFMPMHEHQCWQYADLAEADALSTDNLAALVRARFDRWTMDRMAAFPTRKLMLPRQSSVTWPPRSASMPTCSKAMSGAGEPDVGIGDSFSTTSQSAVSTKRPRRGSDPGFARNCCRASRRRPRWKAR